MTLEEDVELHAARWVGTTIADKYRVDAVLGIGGMGAVYRCHHLGLLRDVAVKLLHADFMEDPNVSPRFDREAQSASRLEHPNCIRVMDYGTWTPEDSSGPVKYMVLELLDGGDLADWVQEPLPAERVVELGLQILSGLEHAHARGVVHRDLKPENVFVTKDHEGEELLKLVDFGLAKVVSGEGSETRLTRTGMVFGTPHYMSPEQATGMPSDERTDVYATGIMLWEMLAGHPPFDGDDPIAVIRQQVSTPLPPPPEHTPAELAALIADMTIKEPEQRTITASEARARLLAIRDGGPAASTSTVASPPGSTADAPQSSDALPMGAAPRSESETVAPVPRAAQTMMVMANDLGGAVGLSPRAVLAIGGSIGGLILIAIIATVAGQGGEGVETGGTDGAAIVAGADALGVGLFSGVEQAELDALDALIDAKDDAAAQARLDDLLREHPEEGALYLRRGLLFARQEGRIADAIEAFDRGFELKPDAVESDRIFETAMRVARHEDSGHEGLELALSRLGDKAHPFLLEQVNRREDVLGYKDRHRILATLESDDLHAGNVDAVFNRALDLWQAKDSGRPCEVYEETLEAMLDKPDPYYVGSVIRSRPPDGEKGGSAVDSKSGKGKLVACPGLEKQRKEAADTLSVRYPEAAKEREVPPDFGRKRRKGGGKKRTRLRDLFK